MLASCWFWDSHHFSATLPLLLISRRLLTTFVHVLCYSAHSYTRFSRAPCAILQLRFKFPWLTRSPTLALFPTLPSSARPGLPWVEVTYSHTHRDHTLYSGVVGHGPSQRVNSLLCMITVFILSTLLSVDVRQLKHIFDSCCASAGSLLLQTNHIPWPRFACWNTFIFYHWNPRSLATTFTTPCPVFWTILV